MAAQDALHNILLFYLHERTWVYRTRAAHELALAQLNQLSLLSPDASAVSESSQSTNSDSPTIKSEDISDSLSLHPDPTIPSSPKSPPQSRWLQRKKSFKLRLEGVPMNTTRLLPKTQQQHRKRRRKPFPTTSPITTSVTEDVIATPPSEEVDPGAKLLQLFGELVDARMESCQRLFNLVRDSNRSMLHYC